MNLHYSQTVRAECWAGLGLIPLWIYITLKPIYTCVINTHRLIPLWIYITLKHITSAHPYQIGLIPLWIYITLKLLLWHACQGICLIPLWIYITLKRKTDSVSNLVVLYLYEFTLLSNIYILLGIIALVLYLYEFTLLSNLKFWKSSLQLVCKSTSLLYILIQ